jgi:hypothetical protein
VRSAKGESVGLHAQIEKLNFKGVIEDGAALANKLIGQICVDDVAAVRLGIGSMVCAGRATIDADRLAGQA